MGALAHIPKLFCATLPVARAISRAPSPGPCSCSIPPVFIATLSTGKIAVIQVRNTADGSRQPAITEAIIIPAGKPHGALAYRLDDGRGRSCRCDGWPWSKAFG